MVFIGFLLGIEWHVWMCTDKSYFQPLTYHGDGMEFGNQFTKIPLLGID